MDGVFNHRDHHLEMLWLQWNLSWETTGMGDHLSWKTRYSWQKVLHFNVQMLHVIEPVTKDNLSLRDHIFMANGVVLQNGFYCTAILEWTVKNYCITMRLMSDSCKMCWNVTTMMQLWTAVNWNGDELARIVITVQCTRMFRFRPFVPAVFVACLGRDYHDHDDYRRVIYCRYMYSLFCFGRCWYILFMCFMYF